MGYEHYLAYYKLKWAMSFSLDISYGYLGYYVSNLWSLADPKELWIIWAGESKIWAGIPQLATMFQNQHNQLIDIPVGTLS